MNTGDTESFRSGEAVLYEALLDDSQLSILGLGAFDLDPTIDAGGTADLLALENAIDENTALVTLSHVTFKSGYLYDMAHITELAHHKGALVLWDLSHSAGAAPESCLEARRGRRSRAVLQPVPGLTGALEVIARLDAALARRCRRRHRECEGAGEGAGLLGDLGAFSR